MIGPWQWRANSRYPCIIRCLLPQLVGQWRRWYKVLPSRPLHDGDGWLRRHITGWRLLVVYHGWRFCRTLCLLRSLWRSGLDTQCSVGCEAKRAQWASKLCLSKAFPRETLKEGEGGQGGVTSSDVLNDAAQRSVSWETFSHRLTGWQPNLQQKTQSLKHSSVVSLNQLDACTTI